MPGPQPTESRGAEEEISDEFSEEVFETQPPAPQILCVMGTHSERTVLYGSFPLRLPPMCDDTFHESFSASPYSDGESSDPENDSASEFSDGSHIEVGDEDEHEEVKFFVDLPVQTFDDFEQLEDELKESSGTRKALVSKYT